MKRIGITIFFVIVNLYLFSQQSNYLTTFDWMVKTFEENDAGFSYYLKQKGVDNYFAHTNSCRSKILKAKSEIEYVQIMNDWLYYFRKSHIGFIPKQQGGLSDLTKDSIRSLYKNEEQVNFSENEFRKYLQDNEKTLKPIEGIWKNQTYTLGIISSKGNANEFTAFIIKADSIYWVPKQIKAILINKQDNNFDVDYFMRNHTKEKTTAKFIGSSFGILSIMSGYWIKAYPQVALSPKESHYYEYITSEKPSINQLSNNTIYIRIPSFMLDQKAAIDKLLVQNDKLIKSTKNLIIDIRNGTGGSDYSHYGLIPYYYTQPIRLMGLIYRGTELNAREYERYSTMHTDSSNIMNCKTIAKKMREHIGGYYNPGESVSTINGFKRSVYPAKVAILCNNNNASADEGFLYMARQSYKVKIFGKPTRGAFDFSNINIVDAPDSNYVLWIAMSAGKNFPEYRIDDIGIQPDFYIDETVNDEDWVSFVQSVIENE